jgi:hypothetical protein
LPPLTVLLCEWLSGKNEREKVRKSVSMGNHVKLIQTPYRWFRIVPKERGSKNADAETAGSSGKEKESRRAF